MAGRGHYAALSADQVTQLFACEDETQIHDEFLESLWEDYDDESWDLVDMDKCWRATHYALTQGCFRETDPEISDYDGWIFWLVDNIYARNWGEGILPKATFGGRMITSMDDNFTFYISPEEVRELAVALKPFTQDWWEEFIKKPSILHDLLPTDDWSYLGTSLTNTVGFFREAAASGKAALFYISI